MQDGIIVLCAVKGKEPVQKIFTVIILFLLFFSSLQDGSITIAANEAKDNVRYLYTLDKFFGPLANASPVSLVKALHVKFRKGRKVFCWYKKAIFPFNI